MQAVGYPQEQFLAWNKGTLLIILQMPFLSHWCLVWKVPLLYMYVLECKAFFSLNPYGTAGIYICTVNN